MKINDEKIIDVCNNSISMAKAASTLGIHFNTLKSRAIKLGCYNINPSGKGIKKQIAPKIPLKDIVDGKHPSFQTNKLRIRLIKEGIKTEMCEVCGITEWNGKKVSFELDHIDGNRTNHKLENLRIICPNCHSQTNTYRARNIK
jgi:RNA polymerase subunit RPABC4/transcription elongation factor Spt4